MHNSPLAVWFQAERGGGINYKISKKSLKLGTVQTNKKRQNSIQ